MKQLGNMVSTESKFAVLAPFDTRINDKETDAAALILPKTLDISISESLQVIGSSWKNMLDSLMNELCRHISKEGHVIFLISYILPDVSILYEYLNQYSFVSK